MSDDIAFARTTDPDTAHAAAWSVNVTALEQRVILVLRNIGYQGTTEEISEASAMPLQSVTPRMRPMVAKGIVRDTGLRKAGNTGRNRIVWELMPEYRQ